MGCQCNKKQEEKEISMFTTHSPRIEDNIILPCDYRKYVDKGIDKTSIFPDSWYNIYEKGKIIYSKQSLLAVYREVFSPENNNDFKEVHNKDNLIVMTRDKGSFLSEKDNLIKTQYVIPKSDLPKIHLKILFKYFFSEKERSTWDTQLKQYKIIEGTEDKVCILYKWLKSPIPLITERDIVEKKYDFEYDNELYSFTSSVDDNFYPLENNVTRIMNVMTFSHLWEDSDNFYYDALSQVDMKSTLPDTLIIGLLSGKLDNYYKAGIDAINKDYNDGKIETE